MGARNRNIFKTLAVVIVILFGLMTVVGSGGSNNDDGSNNEVPNDEEVDVVVIPENDVIDYIVEDDFKVDGHEFVAISNECKENALEQEMSFGDLVKSCGQIITDSDYVIDYDHIYALKYYISNDQLKLAGAVIEVLDSTNTVVKRTEFDIDHQQKDMKIIPEYVIWLVDFDDSASEMITVDVWLVDTSEIESEVYSFDISWTE